MLALLLANIGEENKYRYRGQVIKWGSANIEILEPPTELTRNKNQVP